MLSAAWHLLDSRKSRLLIRRALLSPVLVPVLVFVFFLVANLGINGPVYMSDEVGYLDKAATIAGSTVHFSTSWFGGYSFLISPAFFLSSATSHEWTMILILNALMWAGSAALLGYILRNLYRGRSRKAVQLATAGAMLYPAWLSMSGYAFSTSGFVLLLMASLAALLKSRLDSTGWLLLSAVFAGLLCWMHPFGLLYLGIFVVFIMILSGLKEKTSLVLVAAVAAAIGLAYVFVIAPWFTQVMGGSAINNNHYSHFFNRFSSLPLWHFSWHTAMTFVGLTLYAVIATFGLVVYGGFPVLRKLFTDRKDWESLLCDAAFVVKLVSIVAVLVAIIFTAISFGTSTRPRIDQWMYGRYTDLFLLPVIAFGLMSVWRFRQAVSLAAFVLLGGILLDLVTNSMNTNVTFDNKVNLQGLWPMHLASIIHANYYWLWGLLGALGVFVTGFMGEYRKKKLLFLLIIPVCLAWIGNYIYHTQLAALPADHTSTMLGYIRQNYSKTDCLGFSLTSDTDQRFELYSYYLHGYNLKRISQPKWARQDCRGAYMSWSFDANTTPGLKVIGREKTSGLFLIGKKSELSKTPKSLAAAPLVFH